MNDSVSSCNGVPINEFCFTEVLEVQYGGQGPSDMGCLQCFDAIIICVAVVLLTAQNIVNACTCTVVLQDPRDP